MTKSTFNRKRRELVRQVAELNARLAELDAMPIDPPKPKLKPSRPRIPEWCKPFWERRDGNQHIVFCTAKRKRDRAPFAAYWLFLNGKPVAQSATLDGAKGLASLRSMLYNTMVWDYCQWEQWKSQHPEIDQELDRINFNGEDKERMVA